MREEGKSHPMLSQVSATISSTDTIIVLHHHFTIARP